MMKQIIAVVVVALLCIGSAWLGWFGAVRGAELIDITDSGYTIAFQGQAHNYEY